MLPRIPFDALVLAACLHEVRALVGARVQKVWQPDEDSIVLELYAGQVAHLWIGWDADFPRLYLSPRKPASMGSSPALCMALRATLEGRVLTKVTQPDRDRIAVLDFESATLIFEAFGRAANLILIEPSGRIKSCARLSRGRRSIVPGQPYVAPETQWKPSPFLRELGPDEARVERIFESGALTAVFVPGTGAYPLSVRALGYDEVERQTISVALANYFDLEIPAFRREQRKERLRSQLDRVLLARDVALNDLEQAISEQGRAEERQRAGELILAFQHQIQPGSEVLETWDYEGRPVSIPLDPEITPIANAQVYFDRAKRAKSRRDLVLDQHRRHVEEKGALLSALARLEEADAKGLNALEQEAKDRRWLFLQKPPTRVEERPYGGKRIRELLAPGGWTVLVGENAEANDYLTLRVAKPDDWWLHVRGAVSAHAVIPTRKQPDKVPRAVIQFAALAVARNSGQKHASYVPVDYTQKRYVRKVRGAPLGTVLYTHEKTIFVDPVTASR